MLTAQATVATDRPSRYLIQLARHASQMGRSTGHRPRAHGAGDTPPEVRHAEWSDTDGIIEFGWGRCTLKAAQNMLTLRAEAEDEDGLRRIQDGIAARLERIGRRDQLKVTWQQAAPATTPSGEATSTAPTPTSAATAHRRRLSTIGLVAVGALAVAVHLGLGAAALAHSWWTGPVADLILVLIAVKLLVAGRYAVHRNRASKAARGRR
jgi:hypothetical protein